MGLRWYEGISRGQWMALAAALLGWMFDGFEMGIFPLAGRPALRQMLGSSVTNADVGVWMGRITAAFLVGAALGGWFFGWLGDRVGRVRAMVLSVVTYAMFTGLCGLAMEPWHFVGLRFLSALGMGGEWSLGVALVMELWPTRSRPVLAGFIGAAGNCGYILTVALTETVTALSIDIQDGGWRWVFASCALPAILTFFVRMFVPESEGWKHAAETKTPVQLIDIFTPSLWQKTVIAALLSAVPLVATWGSVQWIPNWVGEITGALHGGKADLRMMNLSQICSGLGAVFGSFYGAILADRFPRRWAYAGLCIGSLAVCALLFRGFAGVADVDVTFFATVAAVGALTAAFYGWLPLYLPELFPTRIRATGQGFCFNFGRTVAAVGALGTGWLVSPSVFNGNFAYAGATISLIYLVGLPIIFLAPETRGRPLPE